MSPCLLKVDVTFSSENIIKASYILFKREDKNSLKVTPFKGVHSLEAIA